MHRLISDGLLEQDYAEVAPGVYEHRVWTAVKTAMDRKHNPECHNPAALAAFGLT